METNGSRRGNEAEGCARWPENPPRYLGGYEASAFFRHALSRSGRADGENGQNWAAQYRESTSGKILSSASMILSASSLMALVEICSKSSVKRSKWSVTCLRA